MERNEPSLYNTPNNSISYFRLRQWIGFSGIILPFASMIVAGVVQPSISHYFYSISHTIFVATLCAMSAFLITYKGTYKLENLLCNIAGLCAFVVAGFPTNANGYIGSRFLYVPEYWESSRVINTVHYIFTAVMFFCFVVICLVIFPRSDEKQPIDTKKIRRNVVYRFCGYTMMASMGAILICTYVEPLQFPYYTLFFEITTLLPFSISWLLKGSYPVKDYDGGLLKLLLKPFR